MEAEPRSIAELRAEFERARDEGRGDEVRAAAVAYYQRRAMDGGTQEKAAAELGISRWSLAKWNQRREGKPGVAASGTGDAAAVLKLEVEGLGPPGPARRFSAELKARLAEWARGERARGVGAREIAAQVGVPWESLSRWMGHPTREGGEEPKFRPVQVRAAANAATAAAQVHPVLKSPAGFIVEGLALESLASLLRLLG